MLKCYCKTGYQPSTTYSTTPTMQVPSYTSSAYDIAWRNQDGDGKTHLDKWNEQLTCEPCASGKVKLDVGNNVCSQCPDGSEPNADKTQCVACRTYYKYDTVGCGSDEDCRRLYSWPTGSDRYIGKCSNNRTSYDGSYYGIHVQADISCNEFKKCEFTYATRRYHPNPPQKKI